MTTRATTPATSPPVFAFLGVTATASSINQVFPRWAEVLGLGPVRFEPLDLPLDSDRDAYRAVMRTIRDDPAHRGALVTTHKVRLLDAARDLFDDLDRYARLCGEVSCITKRDGRVTGSAKDPITSGRTLDELLPSDHFRTTGGEVICLGAGGSGLAIAVHLITGRRHDRPRRITLVDRDPDRLDECRAVLTAVNDDGCAVRVVANADAEHNDVMVALATPGSLIVNATGMGKDRPGAPVTERVVFPGRAVVWELNYRGQRDFLRYARQQSGAGSLTVEDGWRYFIHGWSEVIAEVFDIELTPQTLSRLNNTAARMRP